MYLHAYTCYQSDLWRQWRPSRYPRPNEELKQLYLLDKAIARERPRPACHSSQPALWAAPTRFHQLRRQARKPFPRKSPAVPASATRRWAPCHPGDEEILVCSSPRSAGSPDMVTGGCISQGWIRLGWNEMAWQDGRDRPGGKGWDISSWKWDPVC